MLLGGEALAVLPLAAFPLPFGLPIVVRYGKLPIDIRYAAMPIDK